MTTVATVKRYRKRRSEWKRSGKKTDRAKEEEFRKKVEGWQENSQIVIRVKRERIDNEKWSKTKIMKKK